MPRNVFIDLEAITGCRVMHAAAVRKKSPDGGGEDDDGENRAGFLHVLVEEDEAVPDFGAGNPHVYEYLQSMPANMRDGVDSKHQFWGHKVYRNRSEREADENNGQGGGPPA